MRRRPESPDYPQYEEFRKMFGPRGVVRSSADGRVEDTGPLTRKRMETVDDEFLAETLKFYRSGQQRRQPFFVWFNATRMRMDSPETWSKNRWLRCLR